MENDSRMVLSVPKFDGANFIDWEFSVRNNLALKGWSSAVDVTPPEARVQTEPGRSINRGAARALVGLTVSPHLRSLLDGLETATEYIEAMRAHFKKECAATKLQLLGSSRPSSWVRMRA